MPDAFRRMKRRLRRSAKRAGDIVLGALAVRLADALPADVTVLDPDSRLASYVPGHARVRAVVGLAEQIPFSDGSFDAVIVSNAFHHFADQDKAVKEVARVLSPGGGLVVLDFDTRGLMRLNVWAERLFGTRGPFYSPDELAAYLVERGIRGSCFPTSKVSYCFVGRVG